LCAFCFQKSSHATTRQIRDLYNHRSGEEPIIPHSDQDREFQKLLLQALDVIEFIKTISTSSQFFCLEYSYG